MDMLLVGLVLVIGVGSWVSGYYLGKRDGMRELNDIWEDERRHWRTR
jgi:hypothetical protein